MCGRFVSISEKEELEKEFLIDFFETPVIKSFNVAPGQIAGVIANIKGYKYLAFKWGLVPYWSKDEKIGYKLINCRAETITEKPSFKNPFKRRRCLIPANGYFEWKKEKNSNQKIPYYIHFKSNKVFSFAGLWDIWNSSDGSQLYTFTIITTKSSSLVKPIHHRSPLIIKKEDREKWLTTNERDYKNLLDLLKPNKYNNMEMYEVSTIVNKPVNNNQKCIEKL